MVSSDLICGHLNDLPLVQMGDVVDAAADLAGALVSALLPTMPAPATEVQKAVETMAAFDAFRADPVGLHAHGDGSLVNTGEFLIAANLPKSDICRALFVIDTAYDLVLKTGKADIYVKSAFVQYQNALGAAVAIVNPNALTPGGSGRTPVERLNTGHPYVMPGFLIVVGSALTVYGAFVVVQAAGSVVTKIALRKRWREINQVKAATRREQARQRRAR